MAGKRLTKRQQEKMVAAWNARYPVGTSVAVTMDDGNVFRTVTRSQAEMLSGETAVIWVENIQGCYLLERVKAI
ncbi:MAG: hypothetical protein HPY85_06770 [Anaerolineae bacterium]|nr:hypothetical protein [Anaerolineae bacterium]